MSVGTHPRPRRQWRGYKVAVAKVAGRDELGPHHRRDQWYIGGGSVLAYRVVEVPDDAADLTEQLGTKPKFWFEDPDMGLCLFKEARPDTGEDWAEKVAAELADLLGVPHARYELATWQGKRGVVTPTLGTEGSRLVHGNELLARLIPGYPQHERFRVSQHTIGWVARIVGAERILPPPGWHGEPNRAIGVFAGYLLLDAWIANQDRHHENWALIAEDGSIHLCPTYDHASSLGRNERDEAMQRKLAADNPDHGMLGYANRARSAFYRGSRARSPMGTVEVFTYIAERHGVAASHWLKRLASVEDDVVWDILRSIPDERISETGREFAAALLKINKQRLLDAGGNVE